MQIRNNDKKGIILLAGVLIYSLLTVGVTAYAGEEQKQMYGIGSTSKVIVSASVMKLAEEGKIDLDAPLTDYIPEFEMADGRYKKITPRMLLNHSSGLQGSTLVNAMLLGDADTDNHDHLLERLKTQRLKAEPGAWSVYCNDGFTLAEILVERISHMSYTRYLEETLAKPLGLSNLKTPQSRLEDGRLAAVFDGTTGKELPPEYPNVIGSGGVYATAEDLCRLSAIFMHGDGDGNQVLSRETLLAMEEDAYGVQINPEGRDSTLSYGLGWDSVNTYPFHRYGIKALTKGGDTSYYHASLTVLPEENISCAVLSSGGSSTLNQLAVQEILMEYLEEINRIDRKEEDPFGKTKELAAGAVTKEVQDISGWYAGMDMLQAKAEADGTLRLSGKGLKEGISQTYHYKEDGRFYSSSGDYINTTGELSRGSDGRIGKTALEWKTGVEGNCYLYATIYETYPGLGSTVASLPIAQRVEEIAEQEKAMEAWEKRQGREYYLVSDKYSSTAYSTNFMAKVKVLQEPEGYLLFEQANMPMAAIKDDSHADSFLQIPGQAGRDLCDYQIVEQEGREYLDTGIARMISEDFVEPLPDQGTVIAIGEDGEAVWFRTSGQQVVIDVPEQGAFYIYHHGGREMTCISSSYVLDRGTEIRLPQDGRMVFVGGAGVEFRVR